MNTLNGIDTQTDAFAALPGWVPASVRHYLAHTEAGQPIRDLARHCGVHASTVLRQIRKVEQRRDDPLVDAVLSALATASQQQDPLATKADQPAVVDLSQLHDEARRVLRRLCEAGAVLAVAEDMDKAVVVRDAEAGSGMRTAVVDREIAGALALNDWIIGSGAGACGGIRLRARDVRRSTTCWPRPKMRPGPSWNTGFPKRQRPLGASPR